MQNQFLQAGQGAVSLMVGSATMAEMEALHRLQSRRHSNDFKFSLHLGILGQGHFKVAPSLNRDMSCSAHLGKDGYSERYGRRRLERV